MVRTPAETMPFLNRALTLAAVCILTASAVIACGSVDRNMESQTTTWQAIDLPGIPSGTRGVVYDRERDCLWIETRFFKQAGVPLVTLTRLNAVSGTSTPTSLEMPGYGFIAGAIAVDSKGNVWMEWGVELSEYSPETQAVRSWQLPPLTGVTIYPDQEGLDGNAVALTIGSDGEIWSAVHSVEAVFGFNAASNTWDRVVHVPVIPNTRTRLAAMSDGDLLLDGVVVGLNGLTPALAVVTPTAGSAKILPALGARDYALVGGTVAFVDGSGVISKASITDDVATQVTSSAPLAGVPHMIGDSNGHIWFSMFAYQSVGVAMVDITSGEVTTFPFPWVGKASASDDTGPGLSCPNPACATPHNPTFDPQIQAITPDSHGDVWVVTSLPGSGDPNVFTSITPVYKLTGVA